MIDYTKNQIPTPEIDKLFSLVEKHNGISLFSAQTKDDREYTGINPIIILTENELKIGNDSHVISDPLFEMDKLIDENSHLPEEISVLGYISYDFKDRFEEKDLYEKREQKIYPDFYFAIYEHYIISQRDKETSDLIRLDFPFEYNKIELVKSLNAITSPELTHREKSFYKGTSLDKKAFEEAVKKTVEYIKAGDIYQANITRAIHGETELSPLSMALKLYKSNRIAYGVFASIPGGNIFSTSPELFFRTENGKITASPIKGTIARAIDPVLDMSNKEELLHSEKNIAELAMIIDLLRNDLSQVCIPGTVKVPQFPILMTLDNVYHLYADVVGDLLPHIGIGDILKKTFPGGSITGCPKIRACQIIDELEKEPRGIYTGSFGKVSFKGNCLFNIMIRSLFQSGSRIIFNVGGGITLLSDPSEEYEETIHKGTNIWKAINMENIQEEQYCIEE